MKNNVKKGLILAIIIMFINIGFQPIIAEKTVLVENESNFNNVDSEQTKNYLFQTLVDISNNPKVKAFLSENKHDLITNDYDYKNTIQKILSEKPTLLKSMLFTKPEITYEYFETNYNKGLEINKILGEEESKKIVESVSIKNPELFYELKNII